MAGGLLISWDKQFISISKFDSSQRWLWCKGELSSGHIINLVNVYGPHEPEEKPLFWQDRRNIHNIIENEPVCIMGDFNCVRSVEDRENCVYNDRIQCSSMISWRKRVGRK